MCIRFIPLLIKGTLLTTSGWGKLGRLAFCLIFFHVNLFIFYFKPPPPPYHTQPNLKKYFFFFVPLHYSCYIREHNGGGGRGHSM